MDMSAKTAALIIGVVFVLVGLLGFVNNPVLGIFAVNGLHNVVHLLVGLALIGAAAAGRSASKGVNSLVGAVYLLVGVLGLVVGDGELNLLALNAPDHALHFGTAIVLLAVGLAGDRTSAKETAVTQGHWSGYGGGY